MERELHHAPPGLGQPIPVEGTEHLEQAPPFGVVPGRRLIEQWKVCRVGDTPAGQLQGEAGQVDLADLGRGELGSAAMLDLGPQTNGDPGAGAAGSAQLVGLPTRATQGRW